MIFSSSCQDVIRALVYLAKQHSDDYIQVRKITDELQIPHQFLSKNIQIANKAGFVRAKKGVKGGVKLAMRLDEIKIYDIIQAIDGDKYIENCLLGIGPCDCDKPCALHEEWAKRKNELIEIFGAMSLQDIMASIDRSAIGRI